MHLSNKILLASGVSVAFLAGLSACVIEDQRIEQKEVFVCEAIPGCFDPDSQKCVEKDQATLGCKPCAVTKQGTCLPGNSCVTLSPTMNTGRCVRDSEVSHCHDYDGDLFYAADPGFETTCGFSDEKNPQDCDDSDKGIAPNGTEYCDGKDNDCDGCVDGTCSVPGDCLGEDKTKCQALAQLCFGLGNPNDMSKDAVCHPSIGGVLLCQDAQLSYAKMDKVSGQYMPVDGQLACPPAQDPNIRYVDSEIDASEAEKAHFCSTGLDHDCDGEKLDCSTECKNENEACFVYYNVTNAFTINHFLNNSYTAFKLDLLEKVVTINCGLAAPSFEPEATVEEKVKKLLEVAQTCACVGKYQCDEGKSESTCRADGKTLTKELFDAPPDPSTLNWRCLKKIS